jgi:hypothetical protein
MHVGQFKMNLRQIESSYRSSLERKSGSTRDRARGSSDPRNHSRKEWSSTRVDFADSPVRVEVYASEETIEIFVEADFETLPEERRRFALINVPCQQLSQAIGETARRAARDKR